MIKLTFESAKKELEEIVKQIEDGTVEISKIRELYKRGNELYKFCNKELNDLSLLIDEVDLEEGKSEKS
jgi:exodeoxyribonuclease VII small subunit